MGILDDAIRQHLDLKRQHGAREDELRSIEDDAFGGGERPDPFGESGEAAMGGAAAALGGAAAVSDPDASPPPGLDAPAAGGPEAEDPTMLVEAPESGPSPDPAARPDMPPPAEPESAQPAPPADATPPAVPESPDESAGLFDLETAEEGTIDSAPPPADAPASPAEPAFPGGAPAAPAPEDEPEALEPPAAEPRAVEPPAESESLADLMAEEDEPEPELEVDSAQESEEIEALEPESLEEEAVEPPAPSGGPDPPPPPPEPGTEPKGRARGRVHHPTEEHPAPEPDSDDYEFEEDLGPISSQPLEPAGSSSADAPAAEEEGPALFDFETDAGEADMPIGGDAPAEPVSEEVQEEAVSDDFEDLGPATDERPYEEEDSGEAPAVDVRPADTDEEDLLAGSPDFADEEDGDEDLWFEKGPPKDFDFEDEK